MREGRERPISAELRRAPTENAEHAEAGWNGSEGKEASALSERRVGDPALLGEFGGDELLKVGERAEMGEFVGMEGKLEGFLGEDHELGESKGVEAEVGGEADGLGGGLELRAERAFHEAFDDAVDDRGEVRGVAGLAELKRGGVGRR